MEADLPDSEDEPEKDDPVVSGVLWDDSRFPLPSTIKVQAVKEPFVTIEWIRPPVSTILVHLFNV